MILTGSEILKEYKSSRIVINPFNEKLMNPNSYDVTLGKGIKKLPKHVVIDPKNPPELIDCGMNLVEQEWILHPGNLYIATTNEEIGSDYYLPHLHGKSSLGRMGISVHQTAGRGDVGFKWKWTLEITVCSPTKLYVGMRIGQVEFHEVKGDITLYTGKYVGQNNATGARKEKE